VSPSWTSVCATAARKSAIFVLIAFVWRMYDGVVDYSAFDAATLLTMGAFYHAFFVMLAP
jgi:hypothetical protein